MSSAQLSTAVLLLILIYSFVKYYIVFGHNKCYSYSFIDCSCVVRIVIFLFSNYIYPFWLQKVKVNVCLLTVPCGMGLVGLSMILNELFSGCFSSFWHVFNRARAFVGVDVLWPFNFAQFFIDNCVLLMSSGILFISLCSADGVLSLELFSLAMFFAADWFYQSL